MTPTRREDSGAYRYPEAGFSLVEVMAALVILAIAMTAAFATFTSQQKSFMVQSRVAEMQQNLRQAVEYISRDIRLAGYGIPDNVATPGTASPAGITSIRSLYAIDNTTGPDQIYILYLFDMDANQPATVNSIAMGSAGSVTVDNAVGFLQTGGELVIVTNASTADIFQTDSVAGNVLTFGGVYGTIAHILYGLGPPAATVAKARFVRYFIDGSDPAHPTLMVDRNIPGQAAQPVADDIEDMQLEYGIDTSTPADGIVDSWVANPATLSQVRQVRLRYIARTRLPEAGWAETRPALGNHPAGSTSDGYRRRTYDIVLDVRNSGV
jgi:type IV pilus assembly protein PilW